MRERTGDHLHALACEVLEKAKSADILIATAESCTGGHVASLLTDIEGLSRHFDRGFVVYSDEAKTELLGIPPEEVESKGAVSREVVIAMAQGALRRSAAVAAVAVTGYTGPAGKHENGLVHIAAAHAEGHVVHRECHFGEVERDEGRNLAAAAALELLRDTICAP